MKEKMEGIPDWDRLDWVGDSRKITEDGRGGKTVGKDDRSSRVEIADGRGGMKWEGDKGRR